MFFYIHHQFSSGARTAEQLLPQAAIDATVRPNTLYLHPGQQRRVSMYTPGGKLILLGDPVFDSEQHPEKRVVSGSGRVDKAVLYEEIRGHYYWFLITPEGLDCGCSFGAIFPIYYHREPGGIRISSSARLLSAQSRADAPDRRNLLERLLFNYPFFDSTWWVGVRLLPAHHALRLGQHDAEWSSSFDVERHFGTGARADRADLEHLTGLFAEESKLFIPDAAFGISFTGGFDGRTLVAAALNAGHTNFLTYSFGRPGASDVDFPAQQTKRLGIPYLPILLDDAYVERRSAAAALAFMELTEYNGNFGRPHYQYAAEMLSKQVRYILTGNFGSEMFRALHQPGVMMTEVLIRIFAAPDQSWKDDLVRAAEDWNLSFFRPELDALIADLEAYLKPMTGWEANHKFYRFVFNEIFRKYFGPELVMQSHYFNNRTPFLSLRFFKALNETIWSGVHSKLFEKQKNKRMKGQVFYAAFLRQSDPRLYYGQTSKGYSPADVLEPQRLPILLGRVALHKFGRRQEDDSNSVDAFFQRHRQSLYNRIQSSQHPELAQSGLSRLLVADQNRADLEQLIKLYSIAAGWASAGASSRSVLNQI